MARGLSLWLAFGNLNNGSENAGLGYLNGNNDLSNDRWNYLGRLSGSIYSKKAMAYLRITRNRGESHGPAAAKLIDRIPCWLVGNESQHQISERTHRTNGFYRVYGEDTS